MKFTETMKKVKRVFHYDNIVSSYFINPEDEEITADDIVAVVDLIHSGYMVTFNPYTCPAGGAIYDNLKDAESSIKRLRPTAIKINNMCADCMTDCNGTFDLKQYCCIHRMVEE